MAQENKANTLPFKSIPEAAANYEAGNLLTRMIEGAGYRYYWATEGLKPSDLDFKPSKSGQSTWETLIHIYGLSEVIRNVSINDPSVRPQVDTPQDWEKLRSDTLHFLQEATANFKDKSPEELAELNVIFERGGKQSIFPLWNLINGPLSDMIYHTGQIVSFRRTNENPIPKGVNVFLGRTKQ